MKIEVRGSRWTGSPRPPVQGARGYAYFCPCGTRFEVSAPLTPSWDETLERVIEAHEWKEHTLA